MSGHEATFRSTRDAAAWHRSAVIGILAIKNDEEVVSTGYYDRWGESGKERDRGVHEAPCESNDREA